MRKDLVNLLKIEARFKLCCVHCTLKKLSFWLMTKIYVGEGNLSAKSDVFSFGVVLLEMLSGRRAVDKNRPSGQHNLVEWAKPYLANKHKLLRVLDNRLEGQYELDEFMWKHAAFKDVYLQCHVRAGKQKQWQFYHG